MPFTVMQSMAFVFINASLAMNKIYTAVYFALVLIATGCKKDEDTPPPVNNNGGNGGGNNGAAGDVFICGSEDISGQPYPRYWLNGSEVELDSEGRPGSAKAILATADQIVVGGSIREQGSVNNQPCYWINGELHELDNQDGSAFCTVEDLFVVGEDQFRLAGHVRSESGFIKAMYWTPTSTLELTDGSTDAEAHGICVAGNDVYVCGYKRDQAFGGVQIATYWVNGVPVELGSGEEDSQAYDIRVVNGDVIVVGSDADVFGGEPQGVVWVNGVRTQLTNNDEGACYALHTDGNDIYIAGELLFGGDYLAIYWINNASYEPYLPPGWMNKACATFLSTTA